MTQLDAANEMRVTESSVWNWESGLHTPETQRIPAIVAFLRFNPFPPPMLLPERLVWFRKSKGWTRPQFAAAFGVDPATLASWERAEHIPTKKSLKRITDALGEEWGEAKE